MILDLEERVQVAYKKLKQMVHYEKHPLSLRRRLAEFECRNDFQERLKNVLNVISSKAPFETEEFDSWVSEIQCELIPKGVEVTKHDDSQGSFVSNYTSAAHHRVSKVNYLFDGPVELHLISVIWLMIEGTYYDNMLSDHCLGSRLHEYVGSDRDHSGYLFKKYHELYAKWRDSGIQKARDLLEKDGQSVCMIGLDVQEYYYRIELNWNLLRRQIKRRKPTNPYMEFFMQEQLLGERLFRCIEKICKAYKSEIGPLLAITHPDLPLAATCLPIGLSASPVIANWYLKEFDDAILEGVRPAYYGRYVDDILMVIPLQKPPSDEDPIRSLMERLLERAGVIAFDVKHPEKDRFELCSRPGLYLQKQKCVIQFFDAEHSTAGLDKFQKQLEENASDFALLPVDEDDSPVAQVAYDLLYDGSVNKFRSVKAIAENRWALAGHLAKQTQLHLMTDGDLDPNLKDELFKFFKGRNAIDYWDLWERVIELFVVAGVPEEARKFREAIWQEIIKTQFRSSELLTHRDERNVAVSLRECLKKHLDLCMNLSFAISGLHITDGNDGSATWRQANLIRHHLVAVPLLNYTNFEGNFANPSNASMLSIDGNKAMYSPRFVHFDECLSFVSSEYAAVSPKKDLVVAANEVYEIFHGAEHLDITSKISRRASK